jgi:hypothetical protein
VHFDVLRDTKHACVNRRRDVVLRLGSCHRHRMTLLMFAVAAREHELACFILDKVTTESLNAESKNGEARPVRSPA